MSGKRVISPSERASDHPNQERAPAGDRHSEKSDAAAPGMPLYLRGRLGGAYASAAANPPKPESPKATAPHFPLFLQRRMAELRLQASSPTAGIAIEEPAPILARLTGGAALPERAAEQFSGAYDHDFSDVRVHTESTLTRELGARALTVGRDVAFAPGAYRPGTREGDWLIGHELAHVVQQSQQSQQSGGVGALQASGLSTDRYEKEADRAADTALAGRRVAPLSPLGGRALQRAPAPDASPQPMPPDAVTAPPLDDDWMAQLIEREKQAITALKGRAGQLACSYLSMSPASLVLQEGGFANIAKKREEATVHLHYGAVVPRGAAMDERKGFDTAAAATAFATAAATGTGAVVVSHDTLFFVMKLVSSGGPGFNREHVYEVMPAGGVLMALGEDGAPFVAGKSYEPDVGRLAAASAGGAKTAPETQTALPPPAKDLAKLAGMRRPEDQTSPLAEGEADPDVAEIKPEMVEGFLRQYFVARGLEALQANERVTLDEMQVFKGGETTTSAMPPAAQGRIDASRAMGASFKDLLDAEIKLEELMSELGRERSWSASSEAIVELKPGQRLKIKTWKARIEQSQKLLAAAKADLLTRYPLLAQLVDVRLPRSQLAIDVHSAIGKLGRFGVLLGLGVPVVEKMTAPTNPFEGTELSRGGSKEGDAKVREEYLLKLDGVLKAVGKVKADVVGGDLRQLAGMPGLRQRVMADFASISGKNSKLGDLARQKLQELGMSAGDVAATVATVGGAVLQLAGFFFPPLEFLGAVLSFGAAAHRLDRSLEAWQTSRAALTPDQSIGLSPEEAEQQLISESIGMAFEAINLGISLNSAMKAVEGGRAPKSLADEVEEGGLGLGRERAIRDIAATRVAAEAEGSEALKLLQEARAKGMSPAEQSRYLARMLKGSAADPGAVEQTLSGILAAFRKASEGRFNQELMKGFEQAAKQLEQEGRVFVGSPPIKTLRDLATEPGVVEAFAREDLALQGLSAAEIEAELPIRLANGDYTVQNVAFAKKTAFNNILAEGGAVYDPQINIIVIGSKGTMSDAVTALAHEIAHDTQRMNRLENIENFIGEVQAYLAQREFMRALPEELISKHWEWLLQDGYMERIFQHLEAEYRMKRPPSFGESDASILAEEIKAMIEGRGAQ